MYSLRLFGRPSLDGPDGPLTGRAAQKHRLALLALLARSPDGSLSRDKLMGCLWPENEAKRARHLLNVAVHVLRKELGEAALLSLGDDLRLDTDAVHVDVQGFEEALRRGEAEAAVALYPGPFLDGFYLSEAPEFEKWVDGERASLARLYVEALEGLAAEAEARGHALTAVERWRTLVAEDPYNTRFVLRLMAALEAAGDRGNAIQAAREHEDLLRDELGAEPDPELAELVRRLQEAPNGIAPAVWAREWGCRSTSSATDSREEPEPRATPTTTRSGRAAGIAITLSVSILAVAAFVLLTSSRQPDRAPERVVVAPFQNRTGDASLDQLAELAADWIAQDVARSHLLEVVDPVTVRRSLRTIEPALSEGRTLMQALAEATGANSVVAGSIYRYKDSLLFHVDVTEVSGGKILGTVEPVFLHTESPLAGLQELRGRVLGTLATVFDERLAALATPASRPPTYEAYLEYQSGMDPFIRGEYSAAAPHFLRAHDLDSTFTMALLWAATAYNYGAKFRRADSITRVVAKSRNRLSPIDRYALDWLQATRRGDRMAAYWAAKQAAELAPQSNWTFEFGQRALLLNRPEEALEAFLNLDPEHGWIRGWAQYWNALCEAYHALGRHGEELAAARRGRESFNDLTIRFISEARALAALGRVDEVKRLIDESLSLPEQPNLNPGSLMQRAAGELWAHGYRDASQQVLDRAIPWYRRLAAEVTDVRMPRWALAGVLYKSGHLEESQRMFEQLHAEDPTMYSFQSYLGMLAARLGERAEAGRFDAMLAADGPSWNVQDAASRIYWRGCIAALLGERERAVSLLREALAAGLPWALDSIHGGPDLEPLREYQPYRELVRLKG